MSALVLPWRSSTVPLLVAVHCGLILMALLPASVEGAQGASTAPAEAEAFSTIFTKWGITSQIKWNSTEDPCSGVALGNSVTIDDVTYNPFIKCDCTYDNGTTCHITALRVYGMDVTGAIPDELWKLTHLTYLMLDQNYLTGSLSPSIGNLTKMQTLSLGINALSGTLPKELGQLSQLNILNFGTNNFSGPLPSEIGNIVGLQQIYIDSSGVSGEIPSNFANLVNVQTMWASDNEFNGSMPEFIGTWTQLTDLKFEGNSFVGSIPSSAFSNLTSLQTLRIGDLSNGSSSMAFIPKLTNLTTLVLRNVNFSDSIPTDLGGLTSLMYLDLSFNNITGTIPNSLFTLPSLSYLFLGNNKLTGSLPSQKGSSLANIDVSYNQLTGNIPSWISSKLELNLVANNFTEITNSFAAKCGGPQIKSSDGTVFEEEDEALGPATYYVHNSHRWAVSNAGYFLFNSNASYVAAVRTQFNTLDSEIYQTSRLSASSLRYYGLGLENGNYTVLLHFAELVIQNGKTWRSLGRRVFDVYIQGHLVLKNFNIRKEAGYSFKNLKKSFTTQVTENYLEIHLLWAGKGTCCVPAQGTYGPSISGISITPNFVPTVSNEPPYGPSMKKKIILLLAITLPVGCIFLLYMVGFCTIQTSRRLLEARDEGTTAGFATVILVFNCFWLYRMVKRRKEERRRARNFARNGGLLLQEMAANECVVEKTKIFTARELEKATDRFNSSRILGKGGQGTVYKGMLVDGRIVAIKKSNIVDEVQSHQFINEVVILSQINHRNVVKLLGCCLETDIPLLVYEFVPNDTLYQLLHGPNEDFHLTWKMRLQIAIESAGALAYLHSSSTVPIYHRDIKSSNILLDDKYRAKVSDFGISRTITIDEQTHLTTIVQGTMGYLDPEYFRSQQFNDKSDVYSFGVVLVELITGKKALTTTESGDRKVLVMEFLQLLEWSQSLSTLDPRIAEEAKVEEVMVVSNLAARCLNMNGKQRPTMKEVVMVLESIRSASVSNPVEELCLEVNRATDEVTKTFKCPFCSRSFPLQEESSCSSAEVLPLLYNCTF